MIVGYEIAVAIPDDLPGIIALQDANQPGRGMTCPIARCQCRPDLAPACSAADGWRRKFGSALQLIACSALGQNRLLARFFIVAHPVGT